MTPDEAREHLKNPKTDDSIADAARAVLAPINTAEAAAAEAAKAQPAPVEVQPALAPALAPVEAEVVETAVTSEGA